MGADHDHASYGRPRDIIIHPSPLIKKLKNNYMRTKTLLLLTATLLLSCKTQEIQKVASSPTIENQFEGELDYANEGFELVQWQKGGDQITLGRIDSEGNIHFNMPEYDIRALGRNHMESSLQSQFMMSRCTNKGEYSRMGEALFETPYDDVYSQMYPPMYVRKHDLSSAYVSIITDERMLNKENFNKIIGSKYYWMYIDRDLLYKDTCIRKSFKDPNLEWEMTADIAFKKGWNFIKNELVEVQKYGESADQITPKRTHFTIGDPYSKDIKWFLVRTKSDEQILEAKAKLIKGE